MSTPGRLSSAFAVPGARRGSLWLSGQIMPTVGLSLDRRKIGSIGAQLGGNSLVGEHHPPLAVSLPARRHRLS